MSDPGRLPTWCVPGALVGFTNLDCTWIILIGSRVERTDIDLFNVIYEDGLHSTRVLSTLLDYGPVSELRDDVIVVGSTDDSPLLDTVDWNGHPISYLGRTMGEYVAVREWNYDDD